MNPRYKYIAYHEAGHAVLANHFRALKSVSIDPDPLTRFREEGQDITAIIMYAGILAQARYERRGWADVMQDARRDRDLIRRKSARVAEVLREQPQRSRKQWLSIARRILIMHWTGVERVAAALLQHGALTARQVQRLVAEGRPVAF